MNTWDSAGDSESMPPADSATPFVDEQGRPSVALTFSGINARRMSELMGEYEYSPSVYEDLSTMLVWPNPSFGPARCSTCNVWIETGDTCTHCDRIHVRRVLEKHGDSAGVCGPCATQAATQAARTRASGDRVDVGALYDDVLRHKAGLPATCDKAGALDVELCDEPVKPDLFGPNRSERVEVTRKDFELGPLSYTYPEELPADYFRSVRRRGTEAWSVVRA